MGVYSSKPDTRKYSLSGHINTINFDVSSLKGWRRSMEDMFAVKLNILPNIHFFAIFDGHGGSEVSEFCKEVLPKELEANKDFQEQNWQKAFEDTFEKIDNMLRTEEGRKLMNTIHGGEGNPSLSGSSAEVCLITPTEIVIAEVGTSKCILAKRDKTCTVLSLDHNVYDKAERDRIRKAGGWISEGRVNDSLTVTRSLGILNYKMNEKVDARSQIIISTPHVSVHTIQEDFDFVMLATDGTFDLMPEEKVQEKLSKEMKEGKPLKKSIEDLLDSLVAKDTASGDGCDNMTLMVICFGRDRYPNTEAILSVPEPEKQVNLEKKRTDFFGEHSEDVRVHDD